MSNNMSNTLSEEKVRIRERIIYVLSIFPKLSPSMLHMGLGPQIKSETWRPVLADMLARGEVLSQTVSVNTPSAQHRSHTVLSLPPGAETRADTGADGVPASAVPDRTQTIEIKTEYAHPEARSAALA